MEARTHWVRLAGLGINSQVSKRIRTPPAALVLTGLRVPKPKVAELFRGVRAMRESSGYQLILDEGREEGALRQSRKLLLLIGESKLGAPEPGVEAALQAIDDIARLERMSKRLLTSTSWQDLLATR